MNRIAMTVSLTIAAATGLWIAQAQEPAQAAAQGKAKKGGGQKRVDMTALARPIDMHDTVWIEDMTLLEIRDSLKAGKTTALIFAGGMEDNGPYITVSQHNSIVRAMCDNIARKLGNALCAPIVGIAPGNPEGSRVRAAWD
jgi:creatinine amidohydrolase